MRIISSFFDYYDKGIAYGFDPKQIYARETKELSYDHGDSELKNELFSIVDVMPEFLTCGVIAFCGKAYPFYQVTFHTGGKPYTKTYYSIDSMEKDITSSSFQDAIMNHLVIASKAQEIAISLEIKSLRESLDIFLAGKRKGWNGKWYHMWRKVSTGEFDRLYVRKSLPDELFIKHNVPIMMVYKNKQTLILNPRLKEFNFITQYDPVSAFQEIATFIGNNMARQIDPTTNFSDDLKRDIHGFDNWSFRKHKKDK